jgi:CBS domain-containing protein
MMRLKDLMARDVVAVSPDLTLRELVELLAEQEVSGAPVVAPNGRVIGVISTTDIFDFRQETAGTRLSGSGETESPGGSRKRSGHSTFTEAWDPAESEALEWMRTTREADWDILDEYVVADVMTREVVSQPSSATVKKAARYMLDAGVHRVLVIDGGELQGIVTTTDVVRAVAEGQLSG